MVLQCVVIVQTQAVQILMMTPVQHGCNMSIMALVRHPWQYLFTLNSRVLRYSKHHLTQMASKLSTSPPDNELALHSNLLTHVAALNCPHVQLMLPFVQRSISCNRDTSSVLTQSLAASANPLCPPFKCIGQVAYAAHRLCSCSSESADGCHQVSCQLQLSALGICV